jgi:hypothetical protein
MQAHSTAAVAQLDDAAAAASRALKAAALADTFKAPLLFVPRSRLNIFVDFPSPFSPPLTLPINTAAFLA